MKKFIAATTVFLVSLVSAPAAGAEAVAISSEPVTESFRNMLEDELDDGPGSTSILQADSATSFDAEDPDSLVDPVKTRWRVNTYELDYSFEDCATYEVAATFAITANGPDLLEDETYLFGFIDSDDQLLTRSGAEGPAEVGQTASGGVSDSFDGSDIAGSLSVVYLTLTAINYPGFSGSLDTTFSVPTVEVEADRTECPPETTTTTKAPTTTTTAKPRTTETTAPTAIQTDNTRPKPGGSMTLTGSGYKPLSEVQLTIGNTSVGKTTTNNEGSFSTEIKLPANLEGNQTITATGTNPDGTPRVEVLGISITPAPNYGAAPTSLAATGTGIQLSLIGATLSALGLLSLTLRRKLANN